MHAAGSDVFAGDVRSLLDDMDQRHAVAPAQLVVLLELIQDLRCFDTFLAKSFFAGNLQQLAGREPGLLFYRVQISLERHG